MSDCVRASVNCLGLDEDVHEHGVVEVVLLDIADSVALDDCALKTVAERGDRVDDLLQGRCQPLLLREVAEGIVLTGARAELAPEL